MNFIKHFFAGIFGLFIVKPASAFLDTPLEVKRLSNRFQNVSPQEDKIISKRLFAKDPSDFRSQDLRYRGESEISRTYYPKIPMIHTYRHVHLNLETPFSADLAQAQIPPALKGVLTRELADYHVVYFFNVQDTTVNQDVPDQPLALKPHYFVHPDAPEFFVEKDYKTSLRWTVVPGAEGKIEPVAGNFQTKGLLADTISTHRSSHQPEARMAVSGNVMHLKGYKIICLDHNEWVSSYYLDRSYDAYSLVAFQDEQGKKIAVLTYHFLLTTEGGAKDRLDFESVRDRANTLRELIEGRPGAFEGLEAKESFRNMVGELKRFVNFSPRKEETPRLVPQQQVIPQKPSTPVKAVITNNQKLNTAPARTATTPKVVPEPKIESKSRNVMNSFKTVPFNLDPAFGSGRAKGKAQEITREGKTIKVTTDNNAEASYQLESERFSVKPAEKISVPYEITVEAGGKMSLGLLRADMRGWYGKELFLNAGTHKGVYTVTIPEGETEASLVFRNAHFQRNGGPGQTTFTIKDIDILKNEAIKLGPTFGSFKPRGEAQQIIDDGKTIKVITKEDTVSYVLINNKFSVNPGEKISIPYEITVESGGKMSLGLLNTKTTGWYGQQLFLSAGEHKGVYNVTVPEGEREASLVLRNAHLKTPGQTIFTIKNVEILKNVEMLKKDSRERN